MSRKPTVLVVAAVGGHLIEAVCAISEIKIDCVLVCQKKKIDSNRFERVYAAIDTRNNPFIHLYNLIFGCYIFLRERPKSVISTGGAFCLPFALIAKATRTKFVYVDSLARVEDLSNSGKMIYRWRLYDRFYTQWHSLLAKYPDIQCIGPVFLLNSFENLPDFKTYRNTEGAVSRDHSV